MESETFEQMLGSPATSETWLLTGEARGRLLGAAEVLRQLGEADPARAIGRAWAMLYGADMTANLRGLPFVGAGLFPRGVAAAVTADGVDLRLSRYRGSVRVQVIPSPGPSPCFGDPTD